MFSKELEKTAAKEKMKNEELSLLDKKITAI
jgi:hypothetical protein